MTGRQSRAKGRQGETTARHMLEERDYECEDLSAGRASCDILACSSKGVWFSVEVKNRDVIPVLDARKQARQNAKRGTRWMTMCHIAGSRSWLVERQGERPTVWHERESA